MTLEENKAIARRYNEEIWGKGDLTVVDEIVSPDFFEHGTDMNGPNGVKQGAAFIHKTNSNIRITVEDQIAEGDKVMNRLEAHGIYVGGRNDVPDTAIGKQWSITRMFYVIRIVDGKIVEVWHAHDELVIMKQLGAFRDGNELP